jgi:hypothetical protein
MAINALINGLFNVTKAQDLANFCRDVAAFIDRPILTGDVTFGAEVALARTVTVQARDRKGNARNGRFYIAVYVATAARGDPDSAPTLGAPSAGILISNLTQTGASPAYLFLSDSAGKVVFTLTAGGAGTLYLNTSVVGIGNENPIVYT